MTDAARDLVDAAVTRGRIKQLAAALDADPALKREVVALARSRGVALPDAPEQMPAKRLLRLARGREGDSQVRSRTIHRDEAFVCAHCGRDVPPARRTARDHCPFCLHGQHVDVLPGDRASDCGGMLVPVDAERRGDGFKLRYRCARCGAVRANKALLEVEPPDDWEALVALTARARA